jgi:hypothetical protein
MTKLSFAFVLACAASTLGCFGEHRVPNVYYDTCGQGCRLQDYPLAAGGATTPIGVQDIDYTAVRSTDPGVVTFRTDGANRIIATTGVPGTAQLELLDDRNRLLGAYPITVRPTAELRILKGWSGNVPRILAGAPQLLHVSTKAADGSDLKGDGAVQFTLGGTLALAPFALDGDSIGFTGTPGDGTITASCPDATVTQAVTVVAPEAITHMDLSAGGADKDGTVVVYVALDSADGAVYGGECTWDALDPSLVLTAYVGAKLQDSPLSGYVFKLKRPGQFQVTCHMAGQTATTTVSR